MAVFEPELVVVVVAAGAAAQLAVLEHLADTALEAEMLPAEIVNIAFVALALSELQFGHLVAAGAP